MRTNNKLLIKKIGNLKNFALNVVILIIAISVGLNVFRQYSTLIDAEKRNKEMTVEINNLKDTNRILERKIEYATSSAYIEQQGRDKFGLGGENDYWIIATEKKIDNLYQEAKIEEKASILGQWISLFTR